jgi:hypothetical protein
MRICIATTTGGYDHARVLDSAVGQALRLRGAEVEYLLCDKVLPACQMLKSDRASAEELASGEVTPPYCSQCIDQGVAAFSKLDFPVHRLGDYLSDADRKEVAGTVSSLGGPELRFFDWQGLPIGEHAYAGALRYFARGDLINEELGERVLRRYLEAGLRTALATQRLIASRAYDVLVAHHGIYVPQGIIAETARSAGTRVVTYNPAYRRHSFIFSHDRSYHFTMLDEPRAHWTDFDFTPALARQNTRYLESRRAGTNDWIWFHDRPSEDVRSILSGLGCDPDKRFVALLTSVVWDAQLHYHANAFPDMLTWLKQTIAAWKERTDDLQLVIRVHPAEVRGAIPSRQRVTEELAAAFPQLPRNVFVLGPEHQASTYALCEAADSVIIFNTKTGVEIAARGVPVIVAGEAWIRNKGFSFDASSAEQYFELLKQLPLRSGMAEHAQELAERYSYHFFFRRMIPLPFITTSKPGRFRINISSSEELGPGRWPGLDTICNGILACEPFIYPAEALADPFPGESYLETTA